MTDWTGEQELEDMRTVAVRTLGRWWLLRGWWIDRDRIISGRACFSIGCAVCSLALLWRRAGVGGA